MNDARGIPLSMCGINGLFSFDGRPIARADLQTMNDCMRHRGPDDEGLHMDGSLGLSMRRLAIIDLAGGRQPMTTPDGRYTIVVNGEIYNYVELRAGLEREGVRFQTRSDTEVALRLFERRGERFLDDLNGMFALAIWDAQERRLVLVRDRLGIKPLFFWHTPASFGFSSELRSLLAVLPFAREIDPLALKLYALLMYVPHPLCLVKGVEKVRPGHVLTVEADGRVHTRCYWNPADIAARTPEHDGREPEELLARLSTAVALQMRSDVPVGVFLSGGLDSGTLVALMTRHAQPPVTTFSIGYEAHEVDERATAEQVAARYGTRHYSVALNLADIADSVPAVVRYLDEPIGDTAAMPTYLLARLARSHGIKVILNGTGGDEVFGGYNRYAFGRMRQTLSRLPHAIRRMAAKSPPLGPDMAERVRHPLVDYAMQVCGSPALLEQWSRTGVIASDVAPALERYLTGAGGSGGGTLRDLMLLDLQNYLVGDVLMLLDKMTMAASIEGRVPLLDHTLVEWMLGQPDRLKVDAGETKVLLKRAVRDLLPSAVLAGRKQGFGAPLTAWFRQVVQPYFADRDRSRSDARRLVDEAMGPGGLATMLARGSQSAGEAQLAWSAMIFELWYEGVVASERPACAVSSVLN